MPNYTSILEKFVELRTTLNSNFNQVTIDNLATKRFYNILAKLVDSDFYYYLYNIVTHFKNKYENIIENTTKDNIEEAINYMDVLFAVEKFILSDYKNLANFYNYMFASPALPSICPVQIECIDQYELLGVNYLKQFWNIINNFSYPCKIERVDLQRILHHSTHTFIELGFPVYNEISCLFMYARMCSKYSEEEWINNINKITHDWYQKYNVFLQEIISYKDNYKVEEIFNLIGLNFVILISAINSAISAEINRNGITKINRYSLVNYVDLFINYTLPLIKNYYMICYYKCNMRENYIFIPPFISNEISIVDRIRHVYASKFKTIKFILQAISNLEAFKQEIDDIRYTYVNYVLLSPSLYAAHEDNALLVYKIIKLFNFDRTSSENVVNSYFYVFEQLIKLFNKYKNVIKNYITDYQKEVDDKYIIVGETSNG